MILLLALSCTGRPGFAGSSFDDLWSVASLPGFGGSEDTILFDDTVVTANEYGVFIAGAGLPGELSPRANLGAVGLDLEEWEDGVWTIGPAGLVRVLARDDAPVAREQLPGLTGERLAFGAELLAIGSGGSVSFVPLAAVRDGTATDASVVSVVTIDLASNIAAMHWEGSFLYVGSSGDGAFVFDVTDPAAPVRVRQIGRLAACQVIEPVGELLAIGLGVDATLWDVSDPADPVFVSVVRNSGVALRPYGDFLIGADDTNLVITDISDPSVPTNVVLEVLEGGAVQNLAVTDTDIFVSTASALLRLEIDAGTPPPADNDGDGIYGPSDCDDGDPMVRPGALDLCDGIDDDCSGSEDDCAQFGLSPGAVGTSARGRFGAHATGDLDGDGTTDLVLMTPDQGGGGLVLFGPLPSNGAIDVDGEALFFGGAFFQVVDAVAVGDVDGDGQDDLVVSGDGHMHIGRGPFAGPGEVDVEDVAVFQKIDNNARTGAVAILGDGDGDGLVEIGLAGSDGFVRKYEAPFDGVADMMSGGADQILPVPDVDGDGRPDVLFAAGAEAAGGLSHDGSVVLLLGGDWPDSVVDGARLTITGVRTRTLSVGRPLAVTDAHADGVPDLLLGATAGEFIVEGLRAIALDRTGVVSAAHEPAFSTFTRPAEFTDFFPFTVSVGEDLDGDGADDVLATHRFNNEAGLDSFVWGYPKLDATTFDPSRVARRWYGELGDTRWELVPDLTGDGVGDLVAIGEALTVVSGEDLR